MDTNLKYTTFVTYDNFIMKYYKLLIIINIINTQFTMCGNVLYT